MARSRRKNAYKKPAKNAGRQKGVKNLKRVVDAASGEAGFLNQNNVFISEKERAALVKAVKTANRKRESLQAMFAPLPHKEEGRETGMTVGERRLNLGVEVDFSIADKNASLQRFRTKEEFNRYMKNLDRVNSKDYIKERSRLYKRNYQAALLNPENGLGLAYDDVSDILMKIRTMPTEKYLKEVAMNDELTLGYLYDEGEGGIEQKLNAIRSALGLKHREHDSFWDGDEYE